MFDNSMDALRKPENLDMLSNCCLVVTIAMFSSGIPECMGMMKRKSTGNVQFLPFLMTCVNCFAWLSYGRLNHNTLLIYVNGIGALLQLFYMIIFIVVTTDKKSPSKLSLLTFTCLIASHALIQAMFTTEQAVQVFGTICCFITVLMFASPLAQLKTVMLTRSTATLSFPLTFTSFLCGSFWTLFGLAMQDNYIIIPNILGLATSLFRFYLFSKYRSSPSQSASKLSLIL